MLVDDRYDRPIASIRVLVDFPTFLDKRAIVYPTCNVNNKKNYFHTIVHRTITFQKK